MVWNAVGTLLEVGGKLIDRLIPDPVKAAEAHLDLAKMQMNGELAKLAEETAAFKAEQEGITSRWQADTTSDSWLAKNVRPMTLVYILTAYLGLAVADGAGFSVSQAYVTLLGQWGMLVMGAYFGGRTIEKIMDRKRGEK